MKKTERVIDVSCCRMCPFLNWEYMICTQRSFCTKRSAEVRLSAGNIDSMPLNCPLLSMSVTINAKGDLHHAMADPAKKKQESPVGLIK